MSPFQCDWGKKALRLYKKRYDSPVLKKKDDLLSDGTRELFSKEKVVIRGVGRGIAAYLDKRGDAVLVAVHAIAKPSAPFFYTALFNSTFVDWLYCVRLLAGKIPQGSLKYPVSFIESVPIIQARVAEAERKLKQLFGSAEEMTLDQIDPIICGHYGISDADHLEMKRIVETVVPGKYSGNKKRKKTSAA